MKKLLSFFLMMILFGVIYAQPVPNVVFSGVYGGGGNSGAPFKNDYIELYNTTNLDIDLSGFTLYYFAAENWNAGAQNTFTFPAEATIEANSFVLIKAGAGTTVTTPWPIDFDFDASGASGGNMNMSATSGKMLLLKIYHNMSSGNENLPQILEEIQAMADYVDYMPFGSTAIPKFGDATPNLSNTHAGKRKYNDATKVIEYTFNVGADFDKVTVDANTPRNSSYGHEDKVLTPTFTPGGGNYITSQNVTIDCATSGATIHYTTDGSIPTISSPTFSSPIPVSTTTTIKAIGVLTGMDNSAVATATYSFPIEVTNIAAFKAANSATNSTLYKITNDVTFVYNTGRYIYIKDASAGLVIYDNATPTITTTYNNGDVISGGVIGSCTIFHGLYQLVPSINTAAGVAGTPVTPQTITMADLLADFAKYESQLIRMENVTLDSGTFTVSSAPGANIDMHQDENTMVCRNHFNNITGYTTVAEVFYHVTGFPIPYDTDRELAPRDEEDIELAKEAVATPVFDPVAGYYEEPVLVTITTTTEDAEIYYTTDGSTPSETSTLYTEPFTISETTTVKARGFHPDIEPSEIASATYQIKGPDQVSKPTFTPEGGFYMDGVMVTIHCATESAAIYYTINGDDPTEDDMLFINEFWLGSGDYVLRAKAFKDGMEPSEIATDTYHIGYGIEEWDALINIYPNPTTGELRIMNNEQLIINNIEVYDIYGRNVGIKFPFNLLKGCPKGGVVKEGWQPQADGVVLNISHFPAGIYFLKIQTEKGVTTKKIIKN